MVFEPLGTAVLPLAATLPRVSVTLQFRVSADDTLVVKASGKVLPEAKMRVPSALGVSAERGALPVPAEMAGDVQLSAATVLPAPFTVAVPPVLLFPAAARLVEPDGLAVPLSWVAALLLEPLLPPPPPQPASASESVESRSSCDFINL